MTKRNISKVCGWLKIHLLKDDGSYMSLLYGGGDKTDLLCEFDRDMKQILGKDIDEAREWLKKNLGDDGEGILYCQYNDSKRDIINNFRNHFTNL